MCCWKTGRGVSLTGAHELLQISCPRKSQHVDVDVGDGAIQVASLDGAAWPPLAPASKPQQLDERLAALVNQEAMLVASGRQRGPEQLTGLLCVDTSRIPQPDRLDPCRLGAHQGAHAAVPGGQVLQ